MPTRRAALAAVGSIVGFSGVGTANADFGPESDVVPTPDPDGPVIQEVSQSEPSVPADGLAVTARASDPDGDLDRIAFGDGGNEVVIDEVAVAGHEAETTYEFDEVPPHARYGYPTLVWSVSEDGRVGEVETLDPPEVYVPVRAQFVSVTDPVDAGEYLEATVSVEHIGDMQEVGPLPDLHLVAGEVADTASIDLGYGQRTTVQMGYETYPVASSVEFTLELVAGETVADTTTVSVHA